MIIVCPNCSTRLQVDEQKVPSKPFAVRCPKCNSSVNSNSASPAFEQSALAIGDSPSTERQRFDQVRSAPAYQLDSNGSPAPEQAASEEAVKLLLGLLRQQGGALDEEGSSTILPWKRRKVLVCAAEPLRDGIARRLVENGCKVLVAEDTRQAVETMRSNQLQIVVLDGQFDPTEQGAAFVVREINVLRGPNRRRLFFVLISPSLRTMDAHAAFLNNVNAVVNTVDIDDLPRILEIALREYNELYKDFNQALSLSPL
jgi:predicted Zn finger-like uncharacterized protein